MPEGSPGDTFLITVAHELEHRFGIEHATQIERGDGEETIWPHQRRLAAGSS
jgi:hypothetical protein